jgi:hypothetical protein
MMFAPYLSYIISPNRNTAPCTATKMQMRFTTPIPQVVFFSVHSPFVRGFHPLNMNLFVCFINAFPDQQGGLITMDVTTGLFSRFDLNRGGRDLDYAAGLTEEKQTKRCGWDDNGQGLTLPSLVEARYVLDAGHEVFDRIWWTPCGHLLTLYKSGTLAMWG